MDFLEKHNIIITSLTAIYNINLIKNNYDLLKDKDIQLLEITKYGIYIFNVYDEFKTYQIVIYNSHISVITTTLDIATKLINKILYIYNKKAITMNELDIQSINCKTNLNIHVKKKQLNLLNINIIKYDTHYKLKYKNALTRLFITGNATIHAKSLTTIISMYQDIYGLKLIPILHLLNNHKNSWFSHLPFDIIELFCLYICKC